MAGEVSGDAELGAAIRAARRRVGWPQARLAKAVGYGQTWLSAVELGTRGIDPRDLANIARTIGARVDELLGLEASAEESPFLTAMRGYDAVLDARGRGSVLALAQKEADAANEDALVAQLVAAGFGEQEATRAVRVLRATAPASAALDEEEQSRPAGQALPA